VLELVMFTSVHHYLFTLFVTVLRYLKYLFKTVNFQARADWFQWIH